MIQYFPLRMLPGSIEQALKEQTFFIWEIKLSNSELNKNIWTIQNVRDLGGLLGLMTSVFPGYSIESIHTVNIWNFLSQWLRAISDTGKPWAMKQYPLITVLDIDPSVP